MKILLLGDSLFARFEGKEEPHIQASLRELDASLVFQNLAHSGDNSFDLLRVLEGDEWKEADFVFVWIGHNDLATNKQVYLGEFQENLEMIVQKLLTLYSAQQICLLTPSLVDEEKQRYRTNRLVGYYSQIVEEIAAKHSISCLSVASVYENSGEDLPDIVKGSLDDGLHLGALGYEVIAQAMIERVKKKPD